MEVACDKEREMWNNVASNGKTMRLLPSALMLLVLLALGLLLTPTGSGAPIQLEPSETKPAPGEHRADVFSPSCGPYWERVPSPSYGTLPSTLVGHAANE
jgi:hypothetical protein